MKDILDADHLLKWLNETDPVLKAGNKPTVILSYATSLDGSIALNRGEATAISNNISTEAVHHIRAFCDAILVGIGTVISDNPALSVRQVPGNNPIPIIIDSTLKTPLNSQLVRENNNTIIFCGKDPDKQKRDQLERRGVLIIETPHSKRGLSLHSILELLYDRGIYSLMVEGGAEILRSFLYEGLWDKLAVDVAPVFLGGYNVVERDTIASPLRFNSAQWISAGTDQICLINRETV